MNGGDQNSGPSINKSQYLLLECGWGLIFISVSTTLFPAALFSQSPNTDAIVFLLFLSKFFSLGSSVSLSASTNWMIITLMGRICICLFKRYLQSSYCVTDSPFRPQSTVVTASSGGIHPVGKVNIQSFSQLVISNTVTGLANARTFRDKG